MHDAPPRDHNCRGSRFWPAARRLCLDASFRRSSERELQYAGTWMQSERGRTTEITADSAITRMIHQAQRDYFIAPLPHRRAPLVYIRTETVPPNDIYLIFWLTDYHDIVVYRGTREDGRLYGRRCGRSYGANQPLAAANRWPLRCPALFYENTVIALHVRSHSVVAQLRLVRRVRATTNRISFRPNLSFSLANGRHLISLRSNTRAAHIQCCPRSIPTRKSATTKTSEKRD